MTLHTCLPVQYSQRISAPVVRPTLLFLLQYKDPQQCQKAVTPRLSYFVPLVGRGLRPLANSIWKSPLTRRP
jgi:hypothetical protein